ncbi:hypothetical protein GCM10009092_17320 [Bowmanella denitrificans]|uniref:SET domain-containing protein n=1 Tax=Bowmanella denitrificans TaxID=366582 RepID=A0ABP3GU76_9ALTE
MSDDIGTLIEAGKFKKALSLLKKNKKPKHFLSAEQEALCWFNTKQYKLAKISFSEALNMATEPQQRIRTLNNLSAVGHFLQDKELSKNSLIQSVNIDGSIANIQARMKLCNILFEEQHYSEAVEFAKPLLSNEEQSNRTLFFIIDCHQKNNDRVSMLEWLDKAVARSNFLEKNYLLQALNLFHQCNEFEKESSFFKKIEKSIENEIWFSEVRDRITTKNNTRTINYKTTSYIPSHRVDGDNQHAIDVTKKLITTLEKNGAFFDQRIRFVIFDGNLSIVTSQSIEDPTVLMSVPVRCMPLLDDYEFSIDTSYQLICTPKKVPMNSESVPIMQLLIELYNATGKIQQWKDVYPLTALAAHPELLNKLCESKRHSSSLNAMLDLLRSEKNEELLISSYFSSRRFSYNQKTLKTAGVRTHNEVEYGLLSVIDFLNHSMHVPGYSVNEDKPSIEVAGNKLNSGDEIFVRYNFDDPVITYLTYGFVDEHAPWFFSVPLEFQISNGLNIRVLNCTGAVNNAKIPKEMQGLRDFLPSTFALEDNRLDISSLVIPGKDRWTSLMMIVNFILNYINISGLFSNSNQLESAAKEIINKIIEMNVLYWKELRSTCLKFEGYESKVLKQHLQNIEKLSDFALRNIDNYMGASGYLLTNDKHH